MKKEKKLISIKPTALETTGLATRAADASYYVAHKGAVYGITIYDPLPQEVQTFQNSFQFTQ